MATLTDFSASVNVQYSWDAVQAVDNLDTSLAVPGSYSTKDSWSFGNGVGQSANVFYAIELLAGGASGQIDQGSVDIPKGECP